MIIENALIDVDIPEGWEFVRLGYARKDEWYLCNGIPTQWVMASPSSSYWIIVQQGWIWPEWLLAPYITQDDCKNWWWHTNDPTLGKTLWESVGGHRGLIYPKVFDFNPPPSTDWKKSKRRNPRLKTPA